MENKENRKLEKVAGEVITPEWIENEIEKYIDRYCIENNIEDLKKVSQNEFYACLQYINRNVFRNTDILKDKDISISSGCVSSSNNNRYNYNIVNSLLDTYIYISNKYNKVINISGFRYISGISDQCIYNWKAGKVGTATNVTVDIYKKLVAASEESAAARVVSGACNPVGPIAYLNHYHGWSEDRSGGNTTVVKVLTSSELPRLGSDSDKEQ